MLLKIGALSRKTGLTVRTLHHYDDLGLLGPSHRSESGYRLYTEADLIRLHRIQALKQMGCSLAEVKQALDGPPCSGRDMIARQAEVLRDQQRQLAALLDRLDRLARNLDQGGQEVGADWLAVLEMMIMQEKHLTPEAIASLKAAEEREGASLGPRWTALVNEVRQAMEDDGEAPDSPRAQALAWQWIRLGNDTVNGDTRLAAGLDALQKAEPRAQALNGITPAVMGWITQAFAHARASLMAAYLTPDELARVRTRMVATMDRWPPLFAEAAGYLSEGVTPADPRAADLADRWEALFSAAHHGGDPALEAKVRQAFENEPDLLVGMGLDEAVLTFVRNAITLRQHPMLAEEAPAARTAPKPTAYLTGALRAVHQLVDQPVVFRDPLAVRMLGSGAEQVILSRQDRYADPMLMAVRAAVVARSRVALDAWAEAHARGVRQHVVLGAGLDTFAYQQPADVDGRVFEVDLPATQQWKRDCLRDAGIAEPPSLTFVPIDFAHSTLSEALGQAGFRQDQPAFFSWLGVTPYLDEAAIWQTLAVVTACGPGSCVVFDFLKSAAQLSPMERVGREVMAAQVAARGEPFQSEFDPDALRAAMLARGFGTVDVLDPAELNTRFFGDGALRLRPSQGLLRAWVKP